MTVTGAITHIQTRQAPPRLSSDPAALPAPPMRAGSTHNAKEAAQHRPSRLLVSDHSNLLARREAFQRLTMQNLCRPKVMGAADDTSGPEIHHDNLAHLLASKSDTASARLVSL